MSNSDREDNDDSQQIKIEEEEEATEFEFFQKAYLEKAFLLPFLSFQKLFQVTSYRVKSKLAI
jgi:hypothetical protein